MKRTNNVFITLCLLFLLLSPSHSFCDGVDGFFWNKMDKTQKSIFLMGYKMGSLDTIMTLNALIKITNQVASQGKAFEDPKAEQLKKISDAKCAKFMDLTRRGVIRETYIPEEDLEKIVEQLDIFYSPKKSLNIEISDAISKIVEKAYKSNPNMEKALKIILDQPPKRQDKKRREERE